MTSASPELRMLGAILSHVETFFAEAGVPFTPEQHAVVREVHDHLESQVLS